MTDICVGIKDLLIASPALGTFGANTGWSINIGKLVSSPHTAIGIMQSGGLPPNPRYLLDYPSVQIMVRGAANDYQGGLAKAQAVKDRLLGIPSQTLNSDRWVACNMLGDIINLGFDENNCPMFALNFQLIIEPASGTNRVAL